MPTMGELHARYLQGYLRGHVEGSGKTAIYDAVYRRLRWWGVVEGDADDSDPHMAFVYGAVQALVEWLRELTPLEAADLTLDFCKATEYAEVPYPIFVADRYAKARLAAANGAGA